jgi:predicted ATP-grasp superfamily ATP-dependent carboligase
VAGVALARGLAGAGHEVVAAVSERRAPIAASRASSGKVLVPDADRDPQAFVETLADAAGRLGARAVLPGTESGLLALARLPDRLPEGVASGAPDADVALRATDKLALGELAAAVGLATPPTIVVDCADPAPQLASASYPAVLKPSRSQVALPGGGHRRVNAACVASSEEAARALRALPGGLVLLQPFLDGHIVTVNGAAWDGETLATVHQAAERLWPPDCGVLAAARTVAPDAGLEAASRQLIADLGWSGLFNLQFLVHGGVPLLIDLNPRAYYSLALAIAAGVNLPALWASRLLGERAPVPAPVEIGLHFRGELEDARAVWSLARGGKVKAALRAARPARGTVHALAAPGDRRVALRALATLGRGALRQLVARRRRPRQGAGMQRPRRRLGGAP